MNFFFCETDNCYYWSSREACKDFECMIQNCLLYNKPGEDVVTMANVLKKYFDQQVRSKLSGEEYTVEADGSRRPVSNSKAAVKAETTAAVITPSIMRPAAAPSPAGSHSSSLSTKVSMKSAEIWEISVVNPDPTF